MKLAVLLALALSLSAEALVISAASSLKPVLDELCAGDTSAKVNYGASGALLRQIENGAPTDVFLSAAHVPMDELGKKLTARRVFATNTLVVIVPAGGKKAKLPALVADATVKRFALGEPRSVPAGIYGKEALIAQKLWATVEPKLVYAGSVRQVLAFVESGSAEAGIVYETDARASKRVEIAERLDGKLHSPVEYVGAVVASTKDAAAAKKFLEKLTGETGRKVLERHGFGLALR